jgi:hypothetical protein
MGETSRLAAIMAIDVVGYFRLIDEAGTARAVPEHREAALVRFCREWWVPQSRTGRYLTAE